MDKGRSWLPILLTLALVGPFFGYERWQYRLPSEQTALKQFQSHKEQYQRLAAKFVRADGQRR
jgi:hypothetical protein